MCHVSLVTCHVSPVTCNVSNVFVFLVLFFISKKIGQCDGASQWRVCYQRGLPRLVFNCQPLSKQIQDISTFTVCIWHSQLLNIIIMKFNSPILLNLLDNIFPYCPALGAIRRINFSNIDLYCDSSQ